MLLRRVIEHVRNQAWTAIAIDFVIVVAGVFIGIQVSNWNQARVDRDKATAYRERLVDELEFNARQYRQQSAYYTIVRRHGRAVLDGLEGRGRLDLFPCAGAAGQLIEAVRPFADHASLPSSRSGPTCGIA